MGKSLIQYLFPRMTTPREPSIKTLGEMIHDIDKAIADEQTVWNATTDPNLIDSSIFRIESLKKKRQSLHQEAVRIHNQSIPF